MLLLYVSDEKSHLLCCSLEKSVEQTVELLKIYNQSCVLEGIPINDQWTEGQNIDGFFIVSLNKLLNKQLSYITWNIYVDGHSFKGIKSIHNSSVMQSYAYLMLIRKKLLNK